MKICFYIMLSFQRLYFIVFLFIVFSVNAQSGGVYKADSSIVYNYKVVQQKPEFVLGDTTNISFIKYIQGRLIYPQSTLEDNIEGRITVHYTVDTLGNIKDYYIYRGLRADLDKSVLEAFKNASPYAKPAFINGHPVNVKIALSISYKRVSISSELNNEASLADSFMKNNMSIPQFIKGDSSGTEFTKYIINKISYPEKPNKKNIEGIITLTYTVDTVGNIYNTKVLRSTNTHLTKAVTRAFKDPVKFYRPGYSNGRLVPVRLTMVISFTYPKN